MIVAENRDVDCRGCVRNWEHIIEKKAAVVEGIGQNNCIRMDGRDEVGPRDEVLGPKRLEGTSCDQYPENDLE